MAEIYSTNQVFYKSLIAEDLHGTKEIAADLLRVLKKTELIEPVSGQGKGRYKFNTFLSDVRKLQKSFKNRFVQYTMD